MPIENPVLERAWAHIRNLPRLSLANIAPTADDKSKQKCRRGDQVRLNARGRKSPRQAYFAVGSECKKNPFFMKFPKEKYYEPLKFKREYPPLSLLQLQRMVDLDRIDISKPIDLVSICRTGLYYFYPNKNHFGINLTEEGADLFRAKLNLEVQWASEAAIAAIERNGGVITTAYYDMRSLHILNDPKAFFQKGVSIPRRLNPPEDAVVFYTGPENRGYLADPEKISWERLVLAQKYGYKPVKIEDDPDYEMLSLKKDPRQIFYGLEPGWVINLKDRIILKTLDPTLNEYFAS